MRARPSSTRRRTAAAVTGGAARGRRRVDDLGHGPRDARCWDGLRRPHGAPPGARQPPRRAPAAEIVGSAQRLADELGVTMRAFSYPVGSPDAFDETTKRLVREAGCDIAFAFAGGQTTRHRRSAGDTAHDGRHVAVDRRGARANRAASGVRQVVRPAAAQAPLQILQRLAPDHQEDGGVGRRSGDGTDKQRRPRRQQLLDSHQQGTHDRRREDRRPHLVQQRPRATTSSRAVSAVLSSATRPAAPAWQAATATIPSSTSSVSDTIRTASCGIASASSTCGRPIALYVVPAGMFTVSSRA